MKTEKDSEILNVISTKNKAYFNTHEKRSMWFSFESDEDALNFAKQVVSKINYLTVTIGY